MSNVNYMSYVSYMSNVNYMSYVSYMSNINYMSYVCRLYEFVSYVSHMSFFMKKLKALEITWICFKYTVKPLTQSGGDNSVHYREVSAI